MKKALSFFRDQKGVAALEFALVMPPLFLISMGGIELSQSVNARRQVNNIARMVADNASRMGDGTALMGISLRESDVNDLLLGAKLQADGLDIETNGKIIISSLEQNGTGGQWIHWQRCYGNATYASPFRQGQGRSGNSFPGMSYKGHKIKAPAGDAVIFVEVVYDYRPLFAFWWYAEETQQYRAIAAMNVRDKRDLSGISPDAPAATCT